MKENKKKYEFTGKTINWYGKTLSQIKALINFSYVKAGDVGGYIESEFNLSHEGDCWIYKDSIVYGNAVVSGNAKIYGNAEIGSFTGFVKVGGAANICGHASICGNAEIGGNANICEYAEISEYAEIGGHAKICGNAEISGTAKIGGNAVIDSRAEVGGYAVITSNRDYVTMSHMGDCDKSITAFKTPKGVRIKYWNLYGGIKDFKKKVLLSSYESKYLKEFLVFIELVKVRLKE